MRRRPFLRSVPSAVFLPMMILAGPVLDPGRQVVAQTPSAEQRLEVRQRWVRITPQREAAPASSHEPAAERDETIVPSLRLSYHVPYYPHPVFVSSVRFLDSQRDEALRLGRQAERYRYNVLELRETLARRLGRFGLEPTPFQRYLLGEQEECAGGYGGATTRYPVLYGGYYGGYAGDEALYYLFGRELESHRQDELAIRRQFTLLTYRQLAGMGLAYFREGRYGQAARLFIAAAEKNHEDAAVRIHAAQCLMAAGLYPQALAHLRRAFELQPALYGLPLDLSADFPERAAFDQAVMRLADFCRQHPRRADVWTLLAVMQFYGPHPEQAGDTFEHLRKIAGNDRFVRRLWQSAEPLLAGAR